MDTGGGNAAPFWRGWQVGERVIVRYRRSLATPPGGSAAADHTATPRDADQTAAPGDAAAATTDAGDEDPPLSDALGEVVAIGDDGVTVRTRRGDISVHAAAITLGKRVPPAPVRRKREAG